MKNKGFTLAEVLIVLAIIGIIATITLPTLNANVNAQKAGPALAKAINSLENVNKMVLNDNHVTNLREIKNIGEDFNYITDVLVPHMSGKNIGAIDANYHNFGGAQRTLGNDITGYTSLDGITYIVAGTHDYENAREPYIGNGAINMWVDINGPNRAPNTIGKDTFRIICDMSGRIIPMGGMQFADLDNTNIVLWRDDPDQRCNREGVANTGNSCAGSIADNGYNVIYWK